MPFRLISKKRMLATTHFLCSSKLGKSGTSVPVQIWQQRQRECWKQCIFFTIINWVNLELLFLFSSGSSLVCLHTSMYSKMQRFSAEKLYNIRSGVEGSLKKNVPKTTCSPHGQSTSFSILGCHTEYPLPRQPVILTCQSTHW